MTQEDPAGTPNHVPSRTPWQRIVRAIRDGREIPGHRLTRWLFLRLLGLVLLIAFVSLWGQVHGLIGSSGLLPVADFLEQVHDSVGSEAYRRAPTLLWLADSDAALHGICAAGVILSVVLIVGVAPLPTLFALWLLYLSLSVGGQTFLSFQWDTLLLETTFTALFLAPLQLRPRWPWQQGEPPRVGLWLVRLLLFKLMLLSGLVKLLSMDDAWWQLTALDVHYYTQPLPAWTAWYAHQLPHAVQAASVFVMFVIEIAVPFLIFFPRRFRLAACAALVLLQLLIAATGNYTFFNLLTIVLCVSLLDDAFLARFVPRTVRLRLDGAEGAAGEEAPRSGGRTIAAWIRPVLACPLLLVTSLTFAQEVVRTMPADRVDGFLGDLLVATERRVLSWGRPALLQPIAAFRTINGYGLFRRMTLERPEIVVEGSRDGRDWVPYEFRWKPGDVDRRPRFVAPHQPRLDWQMWFAALSPRRHQHWLNPLLLRLLEGEPRVLRLLGDNPFPDEPPRFVRLAYYSYEFTTWDEGRQTGAWWRRERRGELTVPLSLESYGKTRP